MGFRPPNAGKGRPKGSLNKGTREIRDWARTLLLSEEYQASAKRRVLAGKAPHVETYCLQLIGGKPAETVDVTLRRVDLSRYSDDELALLEQLVAKGEGDEPTEAVH